MKTKKELRKEIKNRLRQQTEIERNKKSLAIKKKLFSLPEFKRATIVMMYVSCDWEVNTETMIDDALKIGKKIAVPYVLSKEKRMVPALLRDRMKDLTKGPYGIPQPSKDSYAPVAPQAIDLVVVPGVAFTEGGKRLGRGAGYYDTFLRGLSKETTTVGIAFSLQVVPDMPQSERDVPVTTLITDQGS
jgi:5-formyltetrahydrofolate cyclo-ligase